jgi:hypothetical protein
MWVNFYMLLFFILYVIPIFLKIIYIVCFHHFANNNIYIIRKYYKPFILKL